MKFKKNINNRYFANILYLCIAVFRLFDADHCLAEDVSIVDAKQDRHRANVTFVKYLVKSNDSDEVTLVVDNETTTKPYNINVVPVVSIHQEGSYNKVIFKDSSVSESGKKNINKQQPEGVKKLKDIKVKNIKGANVEKVVFKKRKRTTRVKPNRYKYRNMKYNINENNDEEIEIVENYYGSEDEIKSLKLKHSGGSINEVVEEKQVKEEVNLGNQEDEYKNLDEDVLKIKS